VSERSFGGYSYQQRLGTGVFGELYRALSGAGKEARILHVDPHLAARPAFVRALVHFGERMVPLDHPHVVAPRQVGRSGDHMVVVTDPVSGPVSLSELVARSGGRLPPDIALAIGLGAVEGLAFAHSLRVVHGAVHARSVLIDFHGAVRLADFGVAWALVATAAETGDLALLHELSGHLAPELALGQQASELGDVYAAGALLFELLEGHPPPGELRAPPALRQVIERSLATHPGSRLINASELEELLEEAIAADRCPVASPVEVAAFVAERLAAADAALHGETDDLLARLAADDDRERDAADMTEVDPRRPLRGELDLSGLLRLDEVDVMSAPVRDRAPYQVAAAPAPPPPALAPASLAPFAAASPAPLVRVGVHGGVQGGVQGGLDDDRVGVHGGVHGGGVVDDDITPLPRPALPRPGSVTRHLDAAGIDGALVPRPRWRPPRALVWASLCAFALAALGTVLYTRTGLFGASRRAGEERDAERERQEALARHEAAQPRPGEITVTAAEPDAAVWLLLGSTPVDSLPLSAAMVHELRLEHDGYRPHDLRVTGYQWKEDGGSLRARVSADLVPGPPPSPVPPFPQAREGADPPAGPRGRGVVHIESDPPGARVWLLIGFTPRATISGLEAGQDYQLKVLKEGFRPGFAAVRAEEWFLSGPGGPVVANLAREVTLTKQAARRSGKARRRSRAEAGEPVH